jgi:hypothetical protein
MYIYIMEYTEFDDYWIYNADTIIIKPDFDKDISLIKFNDKIVSVVFTNSNQIKYIHDNFNYNNNYNSKNVVLSVFNCTVDNLPPNLLNITFGHCFDQPVDNLPQNLQNLTFGDFFDHPVNYLPQSLLNLTFGHCFDQSVDNLPCSLINLTFDRNFNKSLDNLPNSISSLSFVDISFCDFDKPLNCLPNSISQIKLPKKYNLEIKKIPSKLSVVSCSSTYKFINNLKLINIDIEILNK